MTEISSEFTFWILDAYRKMAAQLHVSGTILTESIALPGVIWWTMPADSRFCMALLDIDREQRREWRISLAETKFWFDPTGASPPDGLKELSGETWLSFLHIEGSSISLWIGERFVKAG
jgi:hypothetical protein